MIDVLFSLVLNGSVGGGHNFIFPPMGQNSNAATLPASFQGGGESDGADGDADVATTAEDR